MALTIAGSDPGGAAGLQADLKTFHAFGVYGASVVTALTAQDTTAVHAILHVDPRFVGAQLDAVLADLPVAAAKTGMFGRAATVEVVSARLAAHPVAHLVVDPVLFATAGQTLTEPAAVDVLRRTLLPLATLVTPNLAEAAALTGRPVHDVAGMRDAARALVDLGVRAALVTGGHLPGAPVDVLCADGALHELGGPRVGERPAHGAGCTLSAAITAGLAMGFALADAVARAQRYVHRALASAPPIGRGSAPLNHLVTPERGNDECTPHRIAPPSARC